MEVWGIFYDRADQKTNHRCELYSKCMLVILMSSKGRPGVCHAVDPSPLPHPQPSSCLFKETIDILEEFL